MTAALAHPTLPRSLSVAESVDPAKDWLERHHQELVSRAKFEYRRLGPEARDEAVAEALAVTTKAVRNAHHCGTLDRLTPYCCIMFAARKFRQGRRAAGYSSTCVLSDATRIKHGLQTATLDGIEGSDGEIHHRLYEALADKDSENPFEVVRRKLDYPTMLDRENVSDKARAVLRFLAQTHGAGRLLDLACELRVSPGRITQMKTELATALARFGYHGPLGTRTPIGS